MTQNPASTPGTSRIVLGAMSGTSADGVDVAAVEITGRGLGMDAKYLGHVEHAYDAELRRRIFAIRESGECRLGELAALGRDITLAYAEATRELMGQLSLSPAAVSAVAAHGQTLYHAPPQSIQWLDPSLLAARTDLAVVSDFRRADLAAGGQGAPLVPFADWILFRSPEKTRVILNLGGIANLTYLPAGGEIEEVIAFDTGPGCCVLDYLVRREMPALGYDRDGELSRGGEPHAQLARFLYDPELPTTEAWRQYAHCPPPKSIDVPFVLGVWDGAERELTRLQAGARPRLADLLVTAANWAACTVVTALRDHLPRRDGSHGELIVAGGGARSPTLVKNLRESLDWLADRNQGDRHITFRNRPPILYDLVAVDSAGLPAQAREAVAFAVLGAATLDGEPSHVPRATGAARRVVLGSITPRPGG